MDAPGVVPLTDLGGRNLYETKTPPASYGFTYYSIGRKPGGND